MVGPGKVGWGLAGVVITPLPTLLDLVVPLQLSSGFKLPSVLMLLTESPLSRLSPDPFGDEV
jgi:hypothetical protein